jgi:hypothetical protein
LSWLQIADSSHTLALDQALLSKLLHLLFWTHAFYNDRESRLAVQKCLIDIIALRADPKLLAAFVGLLHDEAQKPGIATNSAFVLVEWFGLLMQQLGGTPLWEQLAIPILLGDAAALEKCLQSTSRGGIAHSAIIVTRRGFRKLFSHENSREKIIQHAVQVLASKRDQPMAKHSILLGVIAGVAARNVAAKPIVGDLKDQYFSFYIREIIGARVPVPSHIASGLADFFADFSSLPEFEKEIVPALEKGLLRAPEVVLSNVMTPLVQSLPTSYDLSSVLHKQLLKPILSNIKSTNAVVRTGAVTSFKAITSRCHDLGILGKVADEILTPLRTGKLASADHRAIHSEMLEVIPQSKELAEKLSGTLAAVASKEGNELALAAETAVLTKATEYLLQNNEDPTKSVVDAYLKGLVDKKNTSRRIWILRLGDLLASLCREQPLSPNSLKFTEAILSKLTEVYNEVITNPLSASQNSTIIGAYILTAFAPNLLSASGSTSMKVSLSKIPIKKDCLSVDPKSAFLLNPRVYGKLTSDDDLRWFYRALVSAASFFKEDCGTETLVAWSVALIYLTSSNSLSHTISREATDILSKIYAKYPAVVSRAITTGLWYLLEVLELSEKDPLVFSLKIDTHKLHTVLRCICLGGDELEKHGNSVDQSLIEHQACSLLVLGRSDLIPRSSWIDLCMKIGLDPGNLARKYEDLLITEILDRTSQEQKVSLCFYLYQRFFQ